MPKTIAELKTQADTSFPDNSVGAITPALLRNMFNDFLDTTAPVIGAVIAGYGGIKINVSRAGTIPTGGTWAPILNYNAAAPEVSLNATTNLTNGTVTIGRTGTYVVAINISIDFDELNNGRVFYARIFDTSSGGQLGESVEIAVGRNSAGVLINFVLPADVTPSMVGHPIRVELGNADTAFTTVFIRNVAFFVQSIGV